MNGIHDMGGMDGFGAVDSGADSGFHADWERSVFALDKLLRHHGFYNLDEKRHAVESLPPERYLTASYYERWLDAVEGLLSHRGLLEPSDGTTGASTRRRGDDAPSTDLVDAISERLRADAERREPDAYRFATGDEVRVRNDHPAGHTRCPRYVRGRSGVVVERLGEHLLPDANAHGTPERTPLYSVQFDATELWGSRAAVGDDLCIDLWEPYLRSAHGENS